MKNKILPARETMERSYDTSGLIIYLFLIPFAIIILLLLIVLIIFTQIKQSPENSIDNSYDTQSVVSYNSEDEEKLLTLASVYSPLSDDYKPSLKNYNGIKYDSTLEEPLSALISAAKEDGVTIKVTGGYISKNEQDKLFKSEVERLMQEKDYSQVKAETEAEKSIPKGNHYDRQTGLSITLSTDDNYAWLEANAYKYGFIQRYTKSGEEETKVKADNSLFRYVGIENAKKIRILGMTLDEYVDYVNSR